MRTFDSDVLDRLDAGEIDYIDGATFVFDSGIANLWIGGRGQFDWSDLTIGAQTFYGGGALLSMEVPGNSLQGQSAQVVLRLTETYLVEGSDEPVSIWDDGSSPSFVIDGEPWQGREVLLSTFWRDEDGSVLMREQVERLVMDSMVIETDQDGRQTRVVVLERPDIIQRDVEGKTDNAEFQKLIDENDRGYEHVGQTATQKISWGRVQEEAVS